MANGLDIKIPLSKPDLSGNEETYVVDALRSTWISSSGKFVDRFESEYAELLGTRYASSVSNGTAALHLALVALGIGPNDEVIIPALAYVAVANAVKYVGAKPVLIDIDPQTWCLDPKLIEGALSRKTKGIIAVHNYGHPCDMDAINEIAKSSGLWVVEDAAEAHLASYKDRIVGGLGDVATFSFYGNKLLTSGEGGALTYSNEALHSRIRLLRSQGMDPRRRYYHPVVGYNYRLSNIACALLCAQLERRKDMISRRRAIYETYSKYLHSVPGIRLQPVAAWATVSPWLYSVSVDESSFGMNRDTLAARLEERGVETRPFFICIHKMPPYDECDCGNYTTSEQLSLNGINLPTFCSMSDETVNYVCSSIRDIQRGTSF